MNRLVRSFVIVSTLAFPLSAAPSLSQTSTSTSAQSNAYPPEVAQAFLTACLTEAEKIGISGEPAQAYCSCSLQESQQRFTLEQLVELESRIRPDSIPPELIEIATTCISNLQ
ncbi:hypothetical protein ACQ4M4_06030 [Leptolyngbya sp. AN02str]|uniref:hypothetical protein n=1 Tax=Leptolyngbya sp. AN02str TaxID=3423363 RepID=UPI003D31926A